jgi:flagellar basal body-associated protein FliL
MTMTSMVTHGYSPIEQYQTKGKMGPWTDIYAIGAVMCRAITGEKPPVAADRVIEDDFEWVSNRKPAGYDDTFLNAVDWALRVRVEDRPQSIANFSEHLSVVRAATPPPIPAKLEQSPKIPAEEKKPIKKPKALTTVRKKHKVIAAQSILLISAFIIYLFAENNLKEIKARISEREKTYLSEAEKAANAAELFLAEAELASNSSLATPLPFIFKLDPPSRLYTVNFGAVVAKLGESNYMRTNFEIQSSSNKIEQIIDDNKTSLTEAVIAVLSSQSVDALHSEDGREVVRKNLINKFNKILGDKFVDQISFTEFIIQ